MLEAITTFLGMLVLILIVIAPLAWSMHRFDLTLPGRCHRRFCWHDYQEVGRFDGDYLKCSKCGAERPGAAWDSYGG